MADEKRIEDKIPPQLNVEFDVAPEKDEEESVTIPIRNDPLFFHDDMFNEIWSSPFSNNMW